MVSADMSYVAPPTTGTHCENAYDVIALSLRRSAEPDLGSPARSIGFQEVEPSPEYRGFPQPKRSRSKPPLRKRFEFPASAWVMAKIV